MRYTTIDSPIGQLMLAGDDQGLARVEMSPFRVGSDWEREDDAFGHAHRQLDEYFARDRDEFEIELTLAGNPFELLVWDALRRIPYGETVSYGEIARQIGHPHAPRAVGVANAR